MMIEQAIFEYLSDQLPVPVLLEVPEVPSERFHKIPEAFVVFEKIGGSKTDHINYAAIALQSYSTVNLYGAAALNEEVKEAMEGLPEFVSDVSECRLTADTVFTDTSTKRYRYQCTFDIYY